MQGESSSLSLWTPLLTEATAYHNRPVASLKISWLRNQNTASFATVGTSTVGGNDLVQGLDDQAVTKPDLFEFEDESDNALLLEYFTRYDELLGGLVYSEGFVRLNNTKNRYTPNYSNTIGTAIIPRRPFVIALGYYLPQKSIEQPINVLKGLSEGIKQNKVEKTVEFYGQDYLAFILERQLATTMYQDQRTDQIIRDILLRLGFSTDQFALDTGLNTIGFAWFDENVRAGERLAQIVQSEQGHLYQDEHGIIRFETRRHFRQSPHSSSVHNIDTSDIIYWEEQLPQRIINRCTVVGTPREVTADNVEIWRNAVVEEVPANETITVWANLEDPVTTVVDPVASTDYFGNTASDGSGTNQTSNLTLSITAFAKAVKINITNSYTGTVYITHLKLRGKPALKSSEVVQTYENEASQNKFGIQEYTLESPFISADSFAHYLVRAIVNKHDGSRRRAQVIIRGVPQLQIKDYIVIDDPDTNSSINMRIIEIAGTMRAGEFTQKLLLREITDDEADNWATVGTSIVGGDDVVGL